MKKGLILLFVIIGLALGLVGCLGEAKAMVIKPACPVWASQTYGQVCNSESLSVTPDDIVVLVDWQIGEIQLNDSYVDNVYGVQFFKPDGTQIEPKDMEQGIFYSFKKSTATAAFHIWPNSSYNILSPDTYVILAKP